MWRRRAERGGMLAAVLVTAALAACGSTTTLPQAPATGPLAASPVPMSQTGSALVQIDQSSVTYGIDNSGSLVVHLQLSSTAAVPQTVTLRGTLYDQSGRVIGDVTGGAVNVAPGASLSVELDGPAPNGTIASARYEATAQASPTPTAATPGGSLPTPS